MIKEYECVPNALGNYPTTTGYSLFCLGILFLLLAICATNTLMATPIPIYMNLLFHVWFIEYHLPGLVNIQKTMEHHHVDWENQL